MEYGNSLRRHYRLSSGRRSLSGGRGVFVLEDPGDEAEDNEEEDEQDIADEQDIDRKSVV